MPEKLYIYAVRGLGLLQHVGVDSASNKPKVQLKVKSHTNADVVKPKFSPSRTKKVPEKFPRYGHGILLAGAALARGNRHNGCRYSAKEYLLAGAILTSFSPISYTASDSLEGLRSYTLTTTLEAVNAIHTPLLQDWRCPRLAQLD